MRYAPAALALSLLAAVTASVGYGAERDPNPAALALAKAGQALLAAGKVEDAIDSFEAGLAIDPAYTRLYLNLAEAARRQGLQGKAIHYYREALAREPGNLAAISGEGQAMVEKGALEKARRNLAQLQSLCGTGCVEAKELAATLDRGPRAGVLTAEAATPSPVVTKN
ncbi:MAG: tetratricopeptide repeat protein [Croceibacterium sp.]